MEHELSTKELYRVAGGRSQDYPYLEEQLGILVGMAFVAGALGNPLVLGGAFAVGGLMAMDHYIHRYW